MNNTYDPNSLHGKLDRILALLEAKVKTPERKGVKSSHQACNDYLKIGGDVTKAHLLDSARKLPPYPPVPSGYSHWEDRGCGWGNYKKALYATVGDAGDVWEIIGIVSKPLGCEHLHYIEAIPLPSPKFRYFTDDTSVWKMPVSGGVGFHRSADETDWGKSICDISDFDDLNGFRELTPEQAEK